jgi:CheY-like chemotaxis protein
LLDTIERALRGDFPEKTLKKQYDTNSLHEQTKALRILIAEDIPENQEVLMGLLRTRSYIVEAVSNGREALAALDTRSFDIVLMDVQMPAMDGIEATGAIRAKEKVSGAHVPIIAVTAYAMLGDRERCLEAGMDGYLSKPILAHELFDAIERFATPAQDTTKAATAAPRGQNLTETPSEEVRSDPGDSREVLVLAKSLSSLGAIETAIAGRDLKAIRTHGSAMKGSITSLIAKGAFEAASTLASAAQEGDLARAEDAFRCLHKALTSLRAG